MEAAPTKRPAPPRLRASRGFLAARAMGIATVLAAAAPAASAQDAGLALTLEESIELARTYNPAFRAARNDRDLADWDVRSAYGSLLPSADVSSGIRWQGSGEQLIGNLTQDQLGVADQPSYYISDYQLGLNYRLDGQTLLEPGRARAGRDVADATIRVAEVDLVQTVTRAYLEVLRQEEEVRLTEAQLERARVNLRLARGQLEVGQVTAIDVQQASVQVGRAEVALLQARNARETARLRLLQAMGLDLDRAVTPVTAFGLEEPGWERTELMAAAIASNPVLQQRRGTVAERDHQVRIARSAYFPSVTVSAGIGGFARQASSTDLAIFQAQSGVANRVASCEFQNEIFRRLADPLPLEDCSAFAFTDADRAEIEARNDVFPFGFTGRPPGASLTVSVPIFQGLSRQRQVEAARVQREDARHQVREQELAIEAEISIGLNAVRTAYESALIEQRNQALADEQLRLARERYRLGIIPFVDLVDAETVKAEADRQLLDAIYQYHDAITNLEAVVGARLRD